MLTFGLSAQVTLLTPKAQRKSCIAQVKSNTDNLKSFKKKKKLCNLKYFNTILSHLKY